MQNASLFWVTIIIKSDFRSVYRKHKMSRQKHCLLLYLLPTGPWCVVLSIRDGCLKCVDWKMPNQVDHWVPICRLHWIKTMRSVHKWNYKPSGSSTISSLWRLMTSMFLFSKWKRRMLFPPPPISHFLSSSLIFIRTVTILLVLKTDGKVPPWILSPVNSHSAWNRLETLIILLKWCTYWYFTHWRLLEMSS